MSVLRLALERGYITFADVADGTASVTRVAVADHVGQVRGASVDTYWKAGIRVEHERQVLASLDDAGLESVHPIEVSVSGDAWLGTEAATGARWADLELAPLLETRRFEALGATLRGLSVVEAEHQSDQPQRDYLRPSPVGARVLSAGQLGVLARVQGSSSLLRSFSELDRLPTAFAHGDARPENVFAPVDGIILIDWELAGRRWIFFDVATAIAHIVWRHFIPDLAGPATSWRGRTVRTAPSREAVAQVLRGYRAHEYASSPAGPIAFALTHMAFEGSASLVHMNEKVHLLIAMAEAVADQESAWRDLLLPLAA